MNGPARQPAPKPDLPRLADRAFPRRVAEILQGLLEYGSDEIGRALAVALSQYEQGLYLYSQQAPSPNVRNNYSAALQELRRGRDALVMRFRAEFEAALATLRDLPQGEVVEIAPLKVDSLSLSLVDDLVIEENILVNEIINRAEVRSSLPLVLLGQRLGVLGARPAFEPDTLPLGPRRLFDMLRSAANSLDLGVEHLQLLYKHFDRECMQQLGAFYEALNAYLIDRGVLPNLTYIPFRPRPTLQNPTRAPLPPAADPAPAELGFETVAHEPRRPGQAAQRLPTLDGLDAAADAGHDEIRLSLADFAGLLAAAAPALHPATHWPGQTDDAPASGPAAPDAELFGMLRELMAGRRSLVGKLGGKTAGKAGGNALNARIADAGTLEHALSRMQGNRPRQAQGPVRVAELKHELLSQLRQLADGEASAMAEPELDAFDLIGLLLEHLVRGMHPASPAIPLLGRLQVPLLRVVVVDKTFFTRREHPARQFVDAIVEAGEFLNPADPIDRPLLDRMRALVERANSEYDGNPALFATLQAELAQHLQALARKAELAERRHIDAARGREKLETARLQAAEALDGLLAGKRIPRFLRTLLGQAWSDVLSLTLLRQGEQSEAYQQYLQIAERLIDAALERRLGGRSSIEPDEAESLRDIVDAALVQVGYHADDAQAIAARLLALGDDGDDDAASSTELAMRLKQRVRFGQQVDAAPEPATTAELDADAREALERISALPHGTWFEFASPGGTPERRRLSWFSTATGHCLFLNHRGQRVAESSLAWLARQVARGDATIVMARPGSQVDRALAGVVEALRAFASEPEAS